MVVSAGPDGVRFLPCRLFPERPASDTPTTEELGLEPTALLLGEIGELGQRALQQIGTLTEDGGSNWSAIYPGVDAGLWRSVAELLVSVGNASVMLIAAVREIAGLLDRASEPGLAASERDPALHRASFLFEAPRVS